MPSATSEPARPADRQAGGWPRRRCCPRRPRCRPRRAVRCPARRSHRGTGRPVRRRWAAAIQRAGRTQAPAHRRGDRSPERSSCQPGQRDTQIGGLDVRAQQIRRRRSDRNRRHRREGVVKAGSRSHRHPGADEQAHGAVAYLIDDVGMAHHTGHAQPGGRAQSRRATDVFGVRHGGHPGAQHRAQVLELGASIVAGHLLAGDDGRPARAHAATYGRSASRKNTAAGGVGSCRPARNRHGAGADHLLLNILGQQQYCRSTTTCGGDRLRKCGADVVGIEHAAAVHRDRGEQRPPR